LDPKLGDCKEIHLNNNHRLFQGTSLTIPHLNQWPLTSDSVFLLPRVNPEFELAGDIRQRHTKTLDCYLPFVSQRAGCLSTNAQRFSSPPPPEANPEVSRIAVLLPLSGKYSGLGQAMLNAAQLALFHFADKQFELLPHDTQGTEKGALDAVTLAIGDGASLILGPLFAGSVEAISPAARAAGVKVIAFSNDRTIAGEGVFAMGFLPEEQVQRVVSYAIGQGIKKFAVLAPDNDYGMTITNALKETSDRYGAEITERAFYNPEVSDIDLHLIIKSLANYDERRQALIKKRRVLVERDDEVARLALKRIENLQTMGDVSFEALLIAEGGKKLESIAALLPYYDIDPKKIRMLGTGHWDVSGLGSEPALRGGWFAAPDVNGRLEFMRQYKDTYGEKAPRLATLAYDATALAAIFAQNDEMEKHARSRTKYNIAALTAPHGFKGLDGIFRFVTAGFAERGLSVYQVGEHNKKTISLAPQSFGDMNNQR